MHSGYAEAKQIEVEIRYDDWRACGCATTARASPPRR
jgi:hypothetical protein